MKKPGEPKVIVTGPKKQGPKEIRRKDHQHHALGPSLGPSTDHPNGGSKKQEDRANDSEECVIKSVFGFHPIGCAIQQGKSKRKRKEHGSPCRRAEVLQTIN